MPNVGDVIGERYRLVAPIASGGMGAVWRAEHLELRVEVALKVLLEDAKTPSAERRFRQEAQAAARLRSPHVVQVQDFGVVQGQPYLVMELLAGEDLASRLEGGGPLTPEACARVLDGVAKAVHLAHEHGIIHRDLKPANIFLARVADDEIVKVLDFGIAKVEGAVSGASTTGAGLVGSPAYMSPEQIWAEPLTPATDLWSMGVVAFEMLTGKNPFDDGPLARIFQHIVTDAIPRVSELAPGLPAGLDGFFERALARDVAGRFPDALSFASAFREAAATPIAMALAEPPAISGVERGAAAAVEARPAVVSSSRRPARIALGAAVVVAGAAALLVWAIRAPEGIPDARDPGTGMPTSGAEPALPPSPPPQTSAAGPDAPAAPSSVGPAAPDRSASALASGSSPPARLSSRPAVPPAASPSKAGPNGTTSPSVDPFFGIPQKAR